MYRNFNSRALGVSGRQSELIELALTYRFRGMDLSLEDFCKHADRRGFEHAARFIRSANIRIAGGELPVVWQEDQQRFDKDLQRLQGWTDYLQQLGVRAAYVTAMAGSDAAYHETFELHRQRFTAVADALAPAGLRLGVGFLAPAEHRADTASPFITTPDALITLVKTIGAQNVGAIVDLWHWQLAGGTVDQIEGLGPDQIVCVRLADVPQGASPDKTTQRDRLLPGTTGVVPLAHMLDLLRKMDYPGPVTVFPHPSQLKGLTRDQIVQRAADSIRVLWGERVEEFAEAEEAEESEESESYA